MSQEYDAKSYDKETLKNYISEDDFKYVMMSLNLALAQFWPCEVAVLIGYVLAPFCFGISLLLPNLCIKDAKIGLIKAIERMNALKLNDKGLQITYCSGWCTSWLELTVIRPIEVNAVNEQRGIYTEDIELASSQFTKKSGPGRTQHGLLSGSTSCGREGEELPFSEGDEY